MQKDSNGSLQRETFLSDISVPLHQSADREAVNVSCLAFSLCLPGPTNITESDGVPKYASQHDIAWLPSIGLGA
jgi:hypothetical protein